MFVHAIADVAHFTFPVKYIQRSFEGEHVLPRTQTMFFVNHDGDAVTSKRVIEELRNFRILNPRYEEYKRRKADLPAATGSRKNFLRDQLQKQFGYTPGIVIQQKNDFVFRELLYTTIIHPDLDLGILRFRNPSAFACDTVARFAAGQGVPPKGKSLCRLGFPFPTFTNFDYHRLRDDIDFTAEGTTDTENYPLDGMVTRHLEGQALFEHSAQCLPGQNGSPVFDADGIIWGMQIRSADRPIGDSSVENLRWAGVNMNQPGAGYFNPAICLSAGEIVEFLRLHSINYLSM